MSRDLSPTIRRGRRQCWRAGLGLPLLLVWSLACSDSVGPVKEPTVASVIVEVTRTGPPQYQATPEGISILSCTVDLAASVEGDGTATWRGATFRWYPGTDLSAPFDSASLTSTEVGQSWGQSTIANGRALTSGWIFSATVPFTVTAEYRYRFSGSTDLATERAQFTCQPALPPNPVPPTISGVSVQPSGGPLETGDTLTIQFSATAAAGLWQMLVTLTGACEASQFLPGELATSASRSVSLLIPSGCIQGAPLSVSVGAVDAALQPTWATPALQLTFLDQRPPSLNVAGPLAGGDFFEGDDLGFSVYAADENGLASLYWEIAPAGIRDSMALSGMGQGPTLAARAAASWGSRPQFRFWVRDLAGLSSDTFETALDSIRIHPATVQPVTYYTLPGDAEDAVIDPVHGRVYFVQSNYQQVTAVLMATGVPLWTIKPPSTPYGLDLSASGDSLLLRLVPGLAPSFVVLDATVAQPALNLRPVTSPDSTLPYEINDLLPLPGNEVLVRWAGPTVRLQRLDLATGAARLLDSATFVGYGGGFVAQSPDLGTIAMGALNGEVLAFDVATELAMATGVVPRAEESMVVVGNGLNRLAVALSLFDPALAPVGQLVNTGGGPYPPVALSPDGATLYALDGGLVRYRLSDGAILDRILLSQDYSDLRISRDGQWALAFAGRYSWTGTRFAIIDLR